MLTNEMKVPENLVEGSLNALELKEAAIEFIQLSINSCNIKRMGAWEKNHNADMSVFDSKIAELKKKKKELRLVVQHSDFSGLAVKINTPNGIEYLTLG